MINNFWNKSFTCKSLDNWSHTVYSDINAYKATLNITLVFKIMKIDSFNPIEIMYII